MIKKCKFQNMIQKEVQQREVKYKRLECVKSQFKQSGNIYNNVVESQSKFTPKIPLLREKNLRRPHAIHKGCASYLVQNPMLAQQQKFLAANSDLPFLKNQ